MSERVTNPGVKGQNEKSQNMKDRFELSDEDMNALALIEDPPIQEEPSRAMKLRNPIHPTQLYKRPGPGGRSLTYATTEQIISNMNEVFGHDGWSSEIRESKKEHLKIEGGKAEVVWSCIVRVHIPNSFHDGIGTGIGQGRITDAMEKAMKEAESDALKRACKYEGPYTGLCLYNAAYLNLISSQVKLLK